MKEILYRHELKYYINKYQYDDLRRILLTIAKKDENIVDDKDYMIRSLYFDDYYNTAYREKEDGVRTRKKYRIRIYNCSDRSIKLECKHKKDAFIFKESIHLNLEEFHKIIEGDPSFLILKNHPMANEFFIDYRTNLLRPKVIVDYEREAFIEPVGNVRITFDKKVRAALGREDIFRNNISTYNILPEDIMILEVKFTGFLPENLRKILGTRNYTQVPASKFCLCVDKVKGIVI